MNRGGEREREREKERYNKHVFGQAHTIRRGDAGGVRRGVGK